MKTAEGKQQTAKDDHVQGLHFIVTPSVTTPWDDDGTQANSPA